MKKTKFDLAQEQERRNNLKEALIAKRAAIIRNRIAEESDLPDGFNLADCFIGAPQQQGQETMRVSNIVDDGDNSLNYLRSRLESLRWNKQKDLADKLGLEGIRPATFAEAKAWLKAGNYRFEIGEGVSDEAPYWGLSCFAWGKTAPDRKAYDAGCEKINAARQKALDVIVVKSDEDARLKALEDFEKFTVH